jgi:hypothetical protein
MKRAREEDIRVVVPLDLLPGELWIKEIFLGHIEPNGDVYSLNTLALSMVCKWFADELKPYRRMYWRKPAISVYFDGAVHFYMLENPTSTLAFLTDLKWPDMKFNITTYLTLAEECFARRSTDVFYAVAERAHAFLMPWLRHARTRRDVEQLAQLAQGRACEGRLSVSDLFHLLDTIDWTDTTLQWLARFVAPYLDKHNRADKQIPFLKLRSVLCAIIKNQGHDSWDCMDYIKKIWDHWYDRYNKLEQHTQRHFRVKHTVSLLLEMNYPNQIVKVIYDWPPASPGELRGKELSIRERLNILFLTTTLFTLTTNAPDSRAWLMEQGFAPELNNVILDHTPRKTLPLCQ